MSQVEVLFEFWKDIDWFVIGGPADGDEAQAVHARYPNVKCIGFEPNPTYIAHQRVSSFPGEVIAGALWSGFDIKPLCVPEGATASSGSICRPHDAPDTKRLSVVIDNETECRPLDYFSDFFGPFTNVALWLDLEYAELAALQGAKRLLAHDAIRLINVETYATGNLPAIVNLLCTSEYRFKLRKVWNIGTDARRDAQDYIFTRD